MRFAEAIDRLRRSRVPPPSDRLEGSVRGGGRGPGPLVGPGPTRWRPRSSCSSPRRRGGRPRGPDRAASGRRTSLRRSELPGGRPEDEDADQASDGAARGDTRRWDSEPSRPASAWSAGWSRSGSRSRLPGHPGRGRRRAAPSSGASPSRGGPDRRGATLGIPAGRAGRDDGADHRRAGGSASAPTGSRASCGAPRPGSSASSARHRPLTGPAGDCSVLATPAGARP